MKIKPGLIVAISLCLVALGELRILPTTLPTVLAVRARNLGQKTENSAFKNNIYQLTQSNNFHLTSLSSNLSLKLPKNMENKQNFNNLESNRKLVDAHTRFSFKLFSKIQKEETNKNIFISPLSLGIALSMTYNGANGKTQQAIAQTLELKGISLEELNLASAALKENLVNIDPKVELQIANSFWINGREPLKPEFVQIIKQFYSSEVKNLTFSDPSALSIINSWVNENTNHKIDKILDKIPPNTVFILLNAISFNGTWKYPFPKHATKDHPFILLNGQPKIHPLMFHQIYGLRYYENELFQAVSLPYGDGRLSMYIFLPNKSITIAKFYENLNAENWDKWLNYLNNNEDYQGSESTIVGLPRFKLEYEIDLKDTLKSLGMEIAFNSDADFSRMTPNPLWISFVKQKALIEVDEEGTKAAAVSAVGGSRSAPNEMIIDRPFFCAIRDNQTGVILFMGSVVEPE